MAKSLHSMSESERKAAIARRLSSKTMGLGYWAAVDAQAHLTKRAPGQGGTRPDNSDPGIQVSGKTVDGSILPPCQ